MPDASDSDATRAAFATVGHFAGIGGLELGFHQAGASAKLLCEVWAPAQAVLRARFPGVPIHGDVSSLDNLPDADVIAAGFRDEEANARGLTVGGIES